MSHRHLSESDQAAAEVRLSIYARMTPAEKWQEALRLMTTARDIKRAYLREAHPDWSHDEVESALKKIFLYATT